MAVMQSLAYLEFIVKEKKFLNFTRLTVGLSRDSKGNFLGLGFYYLS